MLRIPVQRLLRRVTPVLLRRNVHGAKLRNVGIVAHIDAGKTTTTEYILYLCGKIDSVGRVDNGDTVMDFLPQERERGITISSAAISCQWKDHQINIIDTPGHVDFSIEVELSSRVLDSCVLVVDAVAGVQCQTKSVWRKISSRKLPAVAFINKMDRVGASLERAMASIQSQLGTEPIALQMPLFHEGHDAFEGFVDLISMQAFRWPTTPSSSSSSSSSDAKKAPRLAEDMEPTVTLVTEDSPEDKDIYAEVQKQRTTLFETLAAEDESLFETLCGLEEAGATATSLPTDQVLDALRRLTLQKKVLPVLCGASLRGIGVHSLLDAVCCLLPSPEEHPLLGTQTGDDASGSPVNGEERKAVQALLQQAQTALLVFKMAPASMSSSAAAGKGHVAYCRVLHGALHPGTSMLNARVMQEERVNALLRPEAQALMPMNLTGPNSQGLVAGNVVCIPNLRYSRAGDILVPRTCAKDLARQLQHTKALAVEIPHPVFSLGVEPANTSQIAQLEAALNVLCLEDPSLVWEKDSESGQCILRGLGELHLEIALDKMRRQHRLTGVSTSAPMVNYRETLHFEEEDSASKKKNSSRTVEANVIPANALIHTKEYSRVLHDGDSNSAGKRLYAGVTLAIAPLSERAADATYSITDEVLQELSATETQAVQEAVSRGLSRGPLGYQVAGVHVYVTQIQRDKDTTPGALRAAIATGLVEMLSLPSHKMLLEPIMFVEVSVPNAWVGSVVADLAAQRRALHLEVVSDEETNAIHNGGSSGGYGQSGSSKHMVEHSSVVQAQVPLERLLGYATALRSLTKGEGVFSAEYFAHLPREE